MRSFPQTFILLSTLLFSSFTQADVNSNVGPWVKNTLSETLSVNYMEEKDSLDKVNENYTLNAWGAIVSFLGGYMDVIRARQLTIHPVFVGDPVVVTSGYSSGIRFWRINQQVLLPEIKAQLFFSLIVLLRSPDSEEPYVIQSLDIIKKPYELPNN